MNGGHLLRARDTEINNIKTPAAEILQQVYFYSKDLINLINLMNLINLTNPT